MRLVFAGTPVFARRALDALVIAGHQVELVLTQPDRRSGRGKRVNPSPVKVAALEHGIAVYQPASLRDPASWDALKACRPDLMIVAAYGLILPQGVLDIPRHGCLNIHASLLPRWRGAAPIQRCIEAGDRRTGITIMQMDAGLDTGPMRSTHVLDISANESGGQLHDRLAELGAKAIVDAVAALARGELACTHQPQDGATYANKISTDERSLDWSRPALELHNKVRAFDPVPGCVAYLSSAPGEAIKIWRSEPVTLDPRPDDVVAGTVVSADSNRVVVACGDGDGLSLLDVQRPGARRLPIEAFQSGRAIVVGDRFSLVNE